MKLRNNVRSGANAIGWSAMKQANARLDGCMRQLTSSDLASLWTAQDALSEAIASAGLHFEGRPYPLCLRPLVIEADVASHIQSIAERFLPALDIAAQLYCSDREVRDLFFPYDHLRPWIISLPKRRPIATVCRLDGLFGSDGIYKIIETNTEGPGGVIQTGLAAHVWKTVSNPLTHGLSPSAYYQRFENHSNLLISELQSAYREETGCELGTAAVVNYKGRFTNEVDWIVRGFEAAGIQASLLDARALKRTARGLVGASGEPIQLVYNKLDVRDMMEATECREYLAACAAQEVVSINPWISQWVLADKAILALLSDVRFHSNFTSEQVELFAHHVPWTRLVFDGHTTDPYGKSVDLIEYIRDHRTTLVLKPTNATRGERVTIGRFTPPETWHAHLKAAALSPCVVQEHVDARRLTALNVRSRSVEEMAWGLDCYVFGGRLAGFHARASVDAVMNVGRNGILLPVA
ncbi:glutathionylspermidine synthase family protein [Bradyrhizobium sp. 188]|uniref:glutathionylspermidine synthase family protein n=1 Tax=Bradyrhizobium sp. 188 TaxID=2782656 RepID=UPI001FF87799|nr:glutathionylspermidine synthase family protein [Bradyrhizobium sp. 188]MCK1501698.1 glutathionylspermidine synthase family protein [Bradyrhizobium sp. 188]